METLEVENEQRNYYEDVYEEKLEFDIDITVKGGMVIKAHKKILQSQNEMFSKQLSSNPNLKTIELTDFDGIAVQTFIDCLYTGKLTKVAITPQLLSVAYYYLWDPLINICRSELRKKISSRNVVDWLDELLVEI